MTHVRRTRTLDRPGLRRSAAAALAGSVALTGAGLLGLAGPAAAATPGEFLAATSGYGGYSTGSGVHVSALDVPGTSVARLSLAQSAAAVAVGRPLVDQDLLGSSILTADPAGRNAFGHGAAANVGLVQEATAPPQVALSTAEALSPAPSTAEPTELLSLPAELAPLAQAQLLPSTAQALTTQLATACPGADGALISQAESQVANAQLLSPQTGQSVAVVGGAASGDGVTDVVSQTGLLPGATGAALVTVTTQSLAPLTLFAGIPGAETTIAALRDLQLRATATGGSGSSLTYGFVDDAGELVADSEEVLRINDTVLTSEQVLGGDGLQLSLGLADVFIGAPVHGLDDDPTTSPTVSSTTVAGSVDFIRVTVPGSVPTGSTQPVADDSPLAPVLNPVLQPVVDGLAPVLQAVQDGLRDAGLGVADVRLGHFEALATVPAGGVVCTDPEVGDDPFGEAFKDVSAQGVAPGATFEYTVRFPNRGTTPVTDVTVVDTVSGGPPALELVSSDPVVSSRDGAALTFDIGTVEPGEFASVSLTFRVPADAPVGTQYANTATITGTYQGRPVTTQVQVPFPRVIPSPVGPCAVDRSTKSASNLQVVTGQQFAYAVNVSNTGGQDCTGVTVTDTLGAGVTLVSCSDACTVSGRDLTWALGTLAPSASTTLTVVVEVVATAGTLPNAAVITTVEGPRSTPDTPGPTVTPTSVGTPFSPAGCPATGCPTGPTGPTASGPRTELPRTGSSGLLALSALVLVGAGVGARRLLAQG